MWTYSILSLRLISEKEAGNKILIIFVFFFAFEMLKHLGRLRYGFDNPMSLEGWTFDSREVHTCVIIALGY